MAERWVEGTFMVQQNSTWVESGKRCVNMAQMYEMHELTSDGVALTHIENDYEDLMFKEPLSHFLP